MTALDQRYGRTRSGMRKGRAGLLATIGVLVAAAVAWAVWTGVGGAANPLNVQTTGVAIGSSDETTVQWLVTGRAGTRLICAIEAQDAQSAVVGLQEVVVPAGSAINRSGETRVRTVRLAVNGLIDSCRDA